MRTPISFGAATVLSAVALAAAAAPALADGRREREREVTEALRRDVDTIVVIYAENRAFDNVYGHLPGRARAR